ncbi:MAG: hypothetical protein P1U54_05855 [Immundisolibacteraceae bacterium]|nr:hypothetical protein [Immundisolibacteraceae bacterium]
MMSNGSRLDEIVERLQELRAEVESEISRLLKEERIQFHYTVKRSKVRFEAGVKKLHRRYRVNSLRYLLFAPAKHVFTAPLIYSLLLPLMFLDAMISLYQAVCFPAYAIPRVARRRYVVIDRHQLSYLNTIEKLNCVYCGYGNGVLAYALEVASRTEQYWCPIKHASRSAGEHERHQKFAGYGDADAYRQRLKVLRRELQTAGSADEVRVEASERGE